MAIVMLIINRAYTRAALLGSVLSTGISPTGARYVCQSQIKTYTKPHSDFNLKVKVTHTGAMYYLLVLFVGSAQRVVEWDLRIDSWFV